ncbi:MAG: YbjN domain-containing protein [Clostridiales bacterium]|nr:YbjN domain-containing protein [Clostridiales bacterium]
MSSMAAQVTAAYFDSKGLIYDMSDDGHAISTGFELNNREGLKILIIFDPNDESVALRAFNVAKIPADKKDSMFAVVNSLNTKYRWIKFVIDEEDNTITAEDDAVIQLDSCGEEVLECCKHIVAIVDKAYPEIMASLFG